MRTKNDVQNPTLPGGVYGKYITIGRAVYYRYDGTRTRYLIFISDGGRYGLDSIDTVEYNGAIQNEADWRFHRGTITKQIAPKTITNIDTGTNVLTSNAHGFVADELVRLGVINGNMPEPVLKTDRYEIRNPTTNTFELNAEGGGSAIDITDAGSGTIIIWKADAGFDDPEQGLPEFVPEIETTLSGIAYIEGKLPAGVSDPVEQPDWDAFRIVGTGRRLMDYDHEGTELGVIDDNPDALENLALQVIDNWIVGYDGRPSRIDWASWRQFRDSADTEIWQRLQITGNEEPPTTPAGFTGRYYSDEDFGQLVLTRQDTTINFPLSSSPAGPGVPATHFSAHWKGQIKAKYSELTTFKIFHDDEIQFWIEGNLIMDEPSWATHTAQYTLVADRYYDVELKFKQGVGPWGMTFKWLSASLAEEIVPATHIIPSDVAVRRYAHHGAFPIATEASEVFERLMERAPGWDWTDDAGLIKFLGPDRPVAFAFSFDRIDDDSKPNFVNQTFQKKRRGLIDRPNFLLFRYRDVLETGFPFKYVQADREALRDFTNGEPTNQPAEDIGVSTRSLAERMAEMEMILKSDPKYIAQLSGGRATSKLRKNFLVTASYYDIDGNFVVDDRFIITFHAWGSPIGRNDFSLLPIPEDFYSDEPVYSILDGGAPDTDFEGMIIDGGAPDSVYSIIIDGGVVGE